MSRSRFDPELEPKVASVRRGRRGAASVVGRRESRAIEASLAPGAVGSAVARRYGVTPQKLFTGRRNARHKAMESPSVAPFVPAVGAPPETPLSSSAQTSDEPAAAHPHTIESDVEGSSVWLWPGADATMVTAIIGALKDRK